MAVIGIRRSLGFIVISSMAILVVCLMAPVPATGGARTFLGPELVRLVLALIGITGLLVGLSVAWHAERHRRLASLLDRLAEPAVLGEMPVGVVDGIGPACVAGLRRPRIYCASDLAIQLEPVELRAVLLHERHHQIDHAPARLILLDAVAWPLRRLTMGRRWLAGARAQIEIAADRYALTSGATRADLASALLKLGDQDAPLGVAGYTASSERRLRALLDDAPERVADRSPWFAAILVSAAVLLVCLVA